MISTKSAAGIDASRTASSSTSSSPVEMLAHAVGRLGEVSAQSVQTAMRLAGPWPSPSDLKGEGGCRVDSVFDNVESLAQTIHRICDDLIEANAAVTRRL